MYNKNVYLNFVYDKLYLLYLYIFFNHRYKDGQLKTFFVGGPNSRKDFHMEAGEEVRNKKISII